MIGSGIGVDRQKVQSRGRINDYIIILIDYRCNGIPQDVFAPAGNAFQTIAAQADIRNQKIAGLTFDQCFMDRNRAVQDIQDRVTVLCTAAQTEAQIALRVQIDPQDISACQCDSGGQSGRCSSLPSPALLV